MRPLLAVAIAIALIAGCHSAGSSSATAPARAAAVRGRHDPNFITEEEIRAAPGQNMYDVVRTLRPAWLMPRHPTALVPQFEGRLVVYIDGTAFGDADALRQLQPGSVLTARYYQPTEAQARFGPGHLGGAIELVSRH